MLDGAARTGRSFYPAFGGSKLFFRFSRAFTAAVELISSEVKRNAFSVSIHSLLTAAKSPDVADTPRIFSAEAIRRERATIHLSCSVLAGAGALVAPPGGDGGAASGAGGR